MNFATISTVTNSLGARPTRRDVVRGLIVTGLGFTALQRLDSSEARKRKKKKNKGNSGGQTCQPGATIGSVNVPANGSAVSTPVLTAGQRYRLRANGFWYTNPSYGQDAFASFALANPSAPNTTYQGVRIGLSVDGGSPDQWGSYHITHNYERDVVGQGKGLSLRYTDPVTTDNSGTLLVEVICA